MQITEHERNMVLALRKRASEWKPYAEDPTSGSRMVMNDATKKKIASGIVWEQEGNDWIVEEYRGSGAISWARVSWVWGDEWSASVFDEDGNVAHSKSLPFDEAKSWAENQMLSGHFRSASNRTANTKTARITAEEYRWVLAQRKSK